MSTGTIFDTAPEAQQMKALLESKGYPLYYREVHEGHSWGNWRALLDEALRYLWPKQTNTSIQFPSPSSLPSLHHYPEPTTQQIRITYSLPEAATPARIILYDAMGRQQAVVRETLSPSGTFSYTLPFASGQYFLQLETPTLRLTRPLTLIR